MQLISTETAHARGPTWAEGTTAGPTASPIGRVTTGVLLGLGAAALPTREWKGEVDLTRAVEDTPLGPTVDVANEYGSGLTLGGAVLGILSRMTGLPHYGRLRPSTIQGDADST